VAYQVSIYANSESTGRILAFSLHTHYRRADAAGAARQSLEQRHDTTEYEHIANIERGLDVLLHVNVIHERTL